MTASGTPDPTNTDMFKNTGSATGVAVAILADASQSTQLKPGGTNNVEYDVASNSAPTLTFKAELRQSGSTAPTSGDVSSTITLNLAYE